MEHLIRGTRLAMALPPDDLYRCIYCNRTWKTFMRFLKHMVTLKGTLRKRCPKLKADR